MLNLKYTADKRRVVVCNFLIEINLKLLAFHNIQFVDLDICLRHKTRQLAHSIADRLSLQKNSTGRGKVWCRQACVPMAGD